MKDIIQGDCLTVLREVADNTFDLIVTSPPYSDSRKKTYGGIAPDKYVDWFLPRAKELLRVLKPDGTFILNIKEKVVNGERHTYVIDLILKMRELGWLWTEEFVWSKKNCTPGHWPNRFRDAWERLLQFNKTRQFRMFQDTVRVPIGDWAKGRLAHLSENDKTKTQSQVGSGFTRHIENCASRELVYPSNVLHLSTECGNKQHSAAFPEGLPMWFIKLFTEPGDIVLDPFVGSGTTCVAAAKLDRDYLGIDNLEVNVKFAKERLEKYHSY